MSYTVNIPFFEGPFDLLYHLIKSQEIDIRSISVSKIADQYLQYLQVMEEFNIDIASEFLVMASTLLRLKSRLLLPAPYHPGEDETGDNGLFSINSTEELIRRVMEHRYFKKPMIFLREREKEQQKIYFRSTGGHSTIYKTRIENYLFYDDLVDRLPQAMEKVIEKTLSAKLKPELFVLDEYIIKNKAQKIVKKLSERGQALYMSALMETGSIEELTTTFLALLEMARLQEVILWQQFEFAPILVSLNEANTEVADVGY